MLRDREPLRRRSECGQATRCPCCPFPAVMGCSWAKKGLLDQGAVALARAHPQISAM